MRAAQAGDRAAVERLFARYLPRLSRIVATRTGRSWRELGLDDDIVQETLVDAYTAIRDGKITNEAGFCNWLARCAQNKILGEIRHGRAAKRGAGAVARFADLDDSYLSASVLEDRGPTTSQWASARETEAELERELQEIDARYREVICLRAYCRMTYREIAQAMGLPSENTANALFLRARKELQRRLSR